MTFSLTHTASDEIASTAQNVYTFSSQSFGAVAGGGETRYIIVVWGSAATGSDKFPAASVTIGGVSATAIAQAEQAPSNSCGAEIWGAAVPTGTTGDVVIDLGGSGNAVGMGLDVFRLIDPANGLTPTDTGVDNAHSSGVVDLSLNVPTDGGFVAVSQSLNGDIDANRLAWVGIDTEHQDRDISTSENYGSASGATAGSPHTVTCTNDSTSPQAMCGASASFGPATASAVGIPIAAYHYNHHLGSMAS